MLKFLYYLRIICIRLEEHRDEPDFSQDARVNRYQQPE